MAEHLPRRFDAGSLDCEAGKSRSPMDSVDAIPIVGRRKPLTGSGTPVPP